MTSKNPLMNYHARMTQQTSLQQLNSKFSKPGILFEAGKGGLTRLTVNNTLQQAELYLHGSHVTHWQPKGHKPVIFVSESSLYQSDKPIRGGVPICWPWFGPKDNDAAAPMHGFARLTSWDVVSVEQDAQGVVTIVTSLPIEAKWQQLAGFHAQVLHRVVFGKTLEMTLTVRNTSSSSIHFAEALHTYFALGDVR